MEEKEKKEKEVKLTTIIGAVLAILAGYLIVVGILIYFFSVNNTLTRKTAQVFPYPAAIVGNKLITVNQLENRVDAARKFYENQDFSGMGIRIDFSTPDGKKRLAIKEKNILNKMIEDAIIEKEANARGIKLTSDDIAQEVDRKLDEYGSKDEVKKDMEKLYGWTLADFENNIVKPDLYQEKLYESFRKTEQGFSQAQDKINQAQNDLKNGKDFEVVVGKYSEGESAKNRGDLGWFSADQMLPEIANAAFSIDKGKTSDIIESSLGFHIIKIEDKKQEDGADKVYIRQIFVRTPGFVDWLSERKKETRIYLPMRALIWDKDNQEVIWRDPTMKQFEDKALNDSGGDISVMF